MLDNPLRSLSSRKRNSNSLFHFTFNLTDLSASYAFHIWLGVAPPFLVAPLLFCRGLTLLLPRAYMKKTFRRMLSSSVTQKAHLLLNGPARTNAVMSTLHCCFMWKKDMWSFRKHSQLLHGWIWNWKRSLRRGVPYVPRHGTRSESTGRMHAPEPCEEGKYFAYYLRDMKFNKKDVFHWQWRHECNAAGDPVLPRQAHKMLTRST